MAWMIPESCPAKATAGEKRLFRLLREGLPDDFLVWYEADVAGRFPDFTVLAPAFGLLVLEVKGWYPRELARVSDHEVDLLRTAEGHSHVERHANPLRQARDYLFRAADLLAREPVLRRADGPYAGKLCFPCGCGVVFTNMRREQLDTAGLAALFPPEVALCRDELDELAAGDDDGTFARRLRRLFAVSFPFEPLSMEQIRTVRATLHREVVLKPAVPPPLVGTPPRADALAVLDLRQEQLARAVGEGHRVFGGVAGSGKTVLLVARAKLLVNRDPAKRVLFLCYNRSLAAALAHQFAGEPHADRVAVRTFAGWAYEVTRLAWDRERQDYRDYEAALGPALLAAVEAWREAQRYDAVFVDEALDFHPEWFRCCVAAVKGGAAGDVLVAVDGAQSVYRRPQWPTWKSVGIHAQGRSRVLTTNYRNTREVLDLAWSVAQAGREAATDEGEAHGRAKPVRALRSGPRPAYGAYASAAAERTAVANLVQRLLASGRPAEDVCVLYPRREGRRIDDLHAELSCVAPVCWLTRTGDARARTEFLTRPGVRLSTVHSAKGLQFPVVVFTALDQLPSPMSDDESADANLLYVGLTRATDRLYVTWSGSGVFCERVRTSGLADSLAEGA